MKNKITIQKSCIGLKQITMIILMLYVFSYPEMALGQNKYDLTKVKLNFNFEEKPLINLLEYIEKNTVFTFFYDQKILSVVRTVSIKGQDLSIEEVLIQIGKEHNLSFKQVNDRISIRQNPNNQPNQIIEISETVKVKGKVTSEIEPEGLPGVTISLKNGKPVSITDFKGEFEVELPEEEEVLKFHSLGYLNKEVVVANQSFVEVIMEDDTQALSEFVVTGYQTISKVNNVGAYNKADLDVLRNRSTSMNVLQRLDGLVPGLHINNTPNSEGADNSILIRGLNSLNANRQPLYVVDGIPQADITRINP